ncbi:MAG TPA: AMP-binding protein, partial [Nitrospira sp.]|nr:AMP-binding protein [Nitrospira sp.]
MIEPAPGSVSSLTGLFHWRCRQKPQSLAYAFVRDNLELGESVTYEELFAKVRALAGTLQHLESGSRVLLLFGPGLNLVSAFWACTMAGLVPVPAPPPDPFRMKNSLPRLRTILDDASASVILTDLSSEATAQLRTLAGNGIHCWTVDELRERQSTATASTPRVAPIAYLQYTSGSTMTPRGVMISQENILSQCRGLVEIADINADSRSLSWLPYFHDYGLVHGILGPFYAGISAFLMSSLTFLRRPLRWLEAIDRYAITHSGGPNFAYESCLRSWAEQGQWSGDLSRWSVASCGAEPIQPRTIDRFCEVFGAHGFRRTSFTPAYGLAESTLVVSSSPAHAAPLFLTVVAQELEANRVRLANGREGDTRTLVGCGPPLPGHRLRIVNPSTQLECSSDEVGEIWVSGPSVSDGYWNRSDLTAESFVPGTGGREEGYLRTGDLGFVHSDQVFVTGRLKDLIILNGRNVYPNDLEQAIEGCFPGLRRGGSAAFSFDGENGERLVIVQETERQQEFDPDGAAAAIRITIAEQFEAPVWDVSFVRSGAIPRTSSGKIQRQACRAAYLDGALPIVASRTAEQVAAAQAVAGRHVDDPVEARVLELLAEQSGTSPSLIDRTTLLVNFGLDSLKVGVIKSRLEDEFDVETTFGQWFGQSTVGELIDALRHSIARHREQSNGAKPGAFERAHPDAEMNSSETTLPLSISQKRIWFLEQAHPGTALNHISLAIRLSGHIDISRFIESVNRVARRHDMLRAGFSVRDGKPWQTIVSTVSVPVRHGSLKDLPVATVEEEIRRSIREETLVPFDLTCAPLLRMLVLERTADEHVVVITVHRLIGDGWSLRLLA